MTTWACCNMPSPLKKKTKKRGTKVKENMTQTTVNMGKFVTDVNMIYADQCVLSSPLPLI